jgi:hypothetical protein
MEFPRGPQRSGSPFRFFGGRCLFDCGHRVPLAIQPLLRGHLNTDFPFSDVGLLIVLAIRVTWVLVGQPNPPVGLFQV